MLVKLILTYQAHPQSKTYHPPGGLNGIEIFFSLKHPERFGKHNTYQRHPQWREYTSISRRQERRSAAWVQPSQAQ